MKMDFILDQEKKMIEDGCRMLAEAKGFTYWPGGISAPDDWDGGEVLYEGGWRGTVTHTWKRFDGFGTIIGYKRKSNDDYDALRNILSEAFDQAASGKGKERHANGRLWDEQPIAEIGRMVGTGFNTGQAIKKLQESSRMEGETAVRELLGAIVYAASAIMLIRENGE